ncbi:MULTISPECIES: AMP-binding protein [Amycolatopsis]|uniref:AMP-binding protein n=1 Tax=Amycolatopsis echigonensis TaxID=2576905 RepID=A0A8E1VUF8_9PSEU|nr:MULTISPECIES: AMP-binding protein [Amycolatopsis]MBB2498454.1 AMP-binding protein [Amycolatopsis echigonensis]
MSSLLSYASGTAELPLLGDTIGADFDRAAACFGDREALVDRPSGRRWTYRDLAVDVDRVAAGLLEKGIRRGDRVGIWAPSSPEWLLVQYATAKIGAILVPVNPGYRADELRFVLRNAGVRLVVSAERFKTSDYRAMLDEVLPQVPAADDVLYVETGDWQQLLDAGSRALAEDPDLVSRLQDELSADDAIHIQYTSGTTGAPKGATLSHHSVLNNGASIGEVLGYSEQDRVCVPVPFYHCFGMVIGNLGATAHGAAIVIPARSFDARSTLEALSAESCTVVMGVPTMFIAQLADPGFDEFDLSALRAVLLGGSPCPVELMKNTMARMGVEEISVCYGMTETAPVSMLTRRDDSVEKRVATVGRVLPHLEVKIADQETGRPVPRGTAGEFCTRGYSVMKGYWNDPDHTAAVLDADGWMHSGDLGVMDDEGYVAITGRIKDMVIRGGENIYPREIEEFLHTHPGIEDAQVIGVPDARMGEELMVWIKMRPGHEPLDARALRAFCSGRLAHFKIPRYVHVVNDFPMTVTGKIRKVEMRALSLPLLDASEESQPTG